MEKIKIGDIVVRKSYNKDVLFIVEDIKELNDKNIAILTGVTIRILADSPLDDLELSTKEKIKIEQEKLNNRLERRIQSYSKQKIYKRYNKKTIYTGKILHLDGDRKYTDKSYKYYRKMGLNAVVKYIPEYKQPIFVNQLLDKYKPDILVVTRT